MRLSCLQGFGTFGSPDGSRYQGGWQANLKHGLGTKVYANGDVYEGLWRNGKAEGPGRYIWVVRNEYDGEWRGGKMHGQGTLKWRTGGRSGSRRTGCGACCHCRGQRLPLRLVAVLVAGSTSVRRAHVAGLCYLESNPNRVSRSHASRGRLEDTVACLLPISWSALLLAACRVAGAAAAAAAAGCVQGSATMGSGTRGRRRALACSPGGMAAPMRGSGWGAGSRAQACSALHPTNRACPRRNLLRGRAPRSRSCMR